MIKLYNTLSRKKEEFKPLKGNEARIYTCGPTVYQYAHIGNLRTYIFADVLRRTLELGGYKVKQVMNITDVGHLTSNQDTGEDKIEKEAEKEKKTPEEIAKFYTDAFLKNLKDLNIETPEEMPKATDNIKEMIKITEMILKKGLAYEAKDGIYFDTQKLSDYGQLSRQKLDLERKSRVKKAKGKKSPTDFALWLKAVGKNKNHIMQWDSPWGKGFPGWHIECTAMSQKYLGDVFDIHTGGIDHIPVHHENEIAQSLAAYGRVPARFFMHGGFLVVNKKKMAKSEGGFITLDDLKKKEFSPLAFRFLCLKNHYRSKINFDWDGLTAAENSWQNLRRKIREIYSYPDEKWSSKNDPQAEEEIERAEGEIKGLFFDDLNIPQAIDALFWFTKNLDNFISGGKVSKRGFKKAISRVYEMADRVLAIDLVKDIERAIKIPRKIKKLAEERKKAKKMQDFKKADKIRSEIEKEGYKIEDNPDRTYTLVLK